MMRKTLACLFCAVVLLALCACGGEQGMANTGGGSTEIGTGTENDQPTETSLYEQGMEMISVMYEMTSSDAFRALMNTSEELETMVEQIAAGKYTKPQSVYQIMLPDHLLDQMLASYEQSSEGSTDLTDSLKESMQLRVEGTLSSQLNGRLGEKSLAVGSNYTASKIFVNHEITGNQLYLYTFEEGFPVVISFAKGEGGAVLATGTFLLDDQVSINSPEEVQAYLVGALPYLSDVSVERVEE